MTTSFRFYIRFLSALVSRYYKGILAGIILGALAFFFSPRIFRLLPPIRPTQTIGIVAQPTLSDLPLLIQSQLSLGLTGIDDTGLAVPALASSWEATDSGKTYVFTIQPGLKWQDNSPLTSTDIKYNFRDAQIDYPDSTHLKITLPDPFSPLPSAVSRPVFKKKLIGVGGYRVTGYKLNGSYVESLTLSPTDQKSTSPVLRYLFYSSENQARMAYKLGLVKVLLDIQDPRELKTWPSTEVSRQLHLDRYTAAFFNTQAPIFSGLAGRNLRLALAYAVDKSRWTGSPQIKSPISAGSWAYYDQIKTYDFDLDHAKQLLSKVEKIPESITINTVPVYLSLAEDIQKDWAALGLDVQVQVSPDIPSDYQVLLLAQAIPTDPDQYSLWHSTQAGNITRLNNPRIDKLLEDGRKTLDIEARKSIYADFQKFLLEESPAIFLFHPHTYTISRQ
ncbi:MAG: Uncharacterized protein G01um101416_847 [Microgenomates group bacterium Gr01-1014_16]|nr:MAG: Uncharacterized protein G01um101416_847 [Microgenomates group bacterium Gr01-1014_16]